MEKNKITFLKEKEFKKKANDNARFLENSFAQNPIQAKFNAFQKLKREISIKDLF
ncbi:hypothetical protein IJX73_06355 [bacterium]|nr:hypothetical protein [bacterium]